MRLEQHPPAAEAVHLRERVRLLGRREGAEEAEPDAPVCILAGEFEKPVHLRESIQSNSVRITVRTVLFRRVREYARVCPGRQLDGFLRISAQSRKAENQY